MGRCQDRRRRESAGGSSPSRQRAEAGGPPPGRRVHLGPRRRPDLYRVWEAERPFELHLDGIIVRGRADMVLDHEDGVPTSLAILDYKTSIREPNAHDLQLQVYADADRREGLGRARRYVHDLQAGTRSDVDITTGAVTASEVTILDAAERLQARDYPPSPGPACRRSEVSTVCPAAKL